MKIAVAIRLLAEYKIAVFASNVGHTFQPQSIIAATNLIQEDESVKVD